MLTVEFTETCLVFTVNVPEDAPAGIVTVVGTCATAALPLANMTTAPPAGAGPLKVDSPSRRHATFHNGRIQRDRGQRDAGLESSRLHTVEVGIAVRRLAGD